MFSLMRSLPGDLTHAARGEPEHVLHQAVSVRMEGHKLLLDKLLAALGAQPWGHAAQATTVVRAAKQVTVIILYVSWYTRRIVTMDAALYLHAHF